MTYNPLLEYQRPLIAAIQDDVDYEFLRAIQEAAEDQAAFESCLIPWWKAVLQLLIGV